MLQSVVGKQARLLPDQFSGPHDEEGKQCDLPLCVCLCMCTAVYASLRRGDLTVAVAVPHHVITPTQNGEKKTISAITQGNYGWETTVL